jgi:hypothetical protein
MRAGRPPNVEVSPRLLLCGRMGRAPSRMPPLASSSSSSRSALTLAARITAEMVSRAPSSFARFRSSERPVPTLSGSRV